MNLKPDPNPNLILQVRDLNFSYTRGKKIIDNVQGTFQSGTFHAIIGPNAAGKSTFLKLLLGHLKPASGRVFLDQNRLSRIPAYKRAAMLSYVPQRAEMSFAYTVADMINMARFALTSNKTAFDEIVIRCDVADMLDLPFSQLSVGQQQRVLLARALYQSAGQGKVMLLDEPTSAMDLHHVHSTMQILQDQSLKGLSIIAVMQDLNLVARYADYVWVLDHGSLVARGDYATVLTPSILEPVYKVRIRMMRRVADKAKPQQRPIFDVDLPPDPKS